jgi:hypothetical protein
MKWLYHIKYKIRAVFGLASIIVVIITGNLVLRERIADLDQSMSSIMNDRLKPSGYIFEITHAVYQKRLLFLDSIANAEAVARIAHHNSTIETLIISYEKTFLTSEEKQEWLAFKKHLHAYNHFESQYFNSQANTTPDRKAMTAEFSGVLENLGHLSNIQIGEGDQLQKHSKSVVNSSIAFSSVEISLLIVLGLFTMAILSISDHVLFNRKDKQSLN